MDARQCCVHTMRISLNSYTNLMLKSTTQGLWSARGEDIIDKSVVGLLCCRAVQENRYTETVRMQSQPLASSMKADTTWTLM